MPHRVRLVPDYFARWPVKVDDRYDESLRDRISPDLVSDIEALADWWEVTFATSVTDNAVPGDPAAVEMWRAKKSAILTRLLAELGDDYMADFS